MGGYVVYGFSDELSSMSPKQRQGRVLFALWEIIPAITSAVITTCYAVQHENSIRVSWGNYKPLYMFNRILLTPDVERVEMLQLRALAPGRIYQFRLGP